MVTKTLEFTNAFEQDFIKNHNVMGYIEDKMSKASVSVKISSGNDITK